MNLVIQDQQLAAASGPKGKPLAFLDPLFPKAQADQKPVDTVRNIYNWDAGQPPAPGSVATPPSFASQPQDATRTDPPFQSTIPAQSLNSAGSANGAGGAGTAVTGLDMRAKTFADASGPMPKPNATAPVPLGPSSQAPTIPNAPLQPVSLGQSNAPAPAIPAAAPRSTNPNTVFLGPRSKNPAVQKSAPSGAVTSWSPAVPATSWSPVNSMLSADGSLGDATPINYDTQYAQQLSELGSQLQQIMNGQDVRGDEAPLISQEPTQIPDTAIERASSADYERVVGKISEGIQAKGGSAGSILDEYNPQLLAAAYMVGNVDPELAQSMRDIASGLAPRGIKNVRDYIDAKITDSATSAQFKREFDEAAAEAQKAPNSQAAQPAMRKLLNHLVKFAREKASSGASKKS